MGNNGQTEGSEVKGQPDYTDTRQKEVVFYVISQISDALLSSVICCDMSGSKSVLTTLYSYNLSFILFQFASIKFQIKRQTSGEIIMIIFFLKMCKKFK